MRQRIRSSLCGALLDRRGVSAVEFALVAPALLLLLFSMYDVGSAMWRTMRLEMAARAGAQYAFARPQDTAGITNTVLDQVTGWKNVTVSSPQMVCRCDNGAAADCTTGSCTTGTVVQAPIGYISITVTQPFQPISPISTYLLPHRPNLRGNVELRLH
ncbi:TadE/TadG family type IV pilus assembly protein [Roseomonas sp. BN140053]|uniref:TadE/TadG family type IV pilus assembly protein n=1 Tax=Roseomonas sp. BN140053 TaxID=3391898 RepID=UPI0039EC5E59